jgi:hypothetical protein
MSKKTIISILSLMILLSMAACSTNQATQAASENTQSSSSLSTEATSPGTQSTANSGEVTGEQLAMGILEMEGTDQAITADQAAQLLIFWQEVQTLNSDTTATSEQFQAIYTEIQGVLTETQMSAIQGITYNLADLQTLLTQLGIESSLGGGQYPGNGQGMGNGTPATDNGTPRAGGGQGNGQPDLQGTPGIQGGGGPGGDGTPAVMGTPNAQGIPDLTGTPGAGMNPDQRQQGNGINNILLQAVVQFLQQKVSG